MKFNVIYSQNIYTESDNTLLIWICFNFVVLFQENFSPTLVVY